MWNVWRIVDAVLTRRAGDSIVSRTSMVIIFVSSLYFTAVSKLIFYKCVCTLVIGTAAYRKGYSCQHVLLRVVEDWKLALDDRKHVAAMLMDLSKAFDSLPHELIIAKFKAYGMKEEGCAFVWAYLSKRKQRVKLSGCASDWMELLKGVPQVSILGPIFFNIFMNDIYATMTRSSLYNYADDNTISVICGTKQDAIDALSQESEVVVDWLHVNMMEANPTKFQAIILRNVDQSTNIPIRDNVVPFAKQVKLLGVTIDHRLNFHQHVSIICRRAGAQLRILQRLPSYIDEAYRMSNRLSFPYIICGTCFQVLRAEQF